MTQKEKLAILLEGVPTAPDGSISTEGIADYLISRGVVIFPCKVGDTVYYQSGISRKLICAANVEEITISDSSWSVYVRSGEKYGFVLQRCEVWFTKAEAEAALKKMEGEK